MMSAPATRPPRATRDKSQKPSADPNKTTDSPALKIQPTAEQIRIAQIINDTKDTDDPEFRNKIKQVVELTGKSSDEASVALHDCDNDPNRAIDMLLEGETDQGEWETSGKRKKNRPAVAPVVEQTPPAPVVPSNNKENRQRSERGGRERDGKELRNRAPPRLNRGRGRDSENNERNLEDSRTRDKSGERRAPRNSRVINGGASRGGGRGRVASGIGRVRTFQNRGAAQPRFNRPIDTWTNVGGEPADADQQMSVGNWSDNFPPAEDWDNEDWTGSLAETKVFTPSAHVASDSDNTTSAPSLHPSTILPSLPLQSSNQTVGDGTCLSTSQTAVSSGTSVLCADDMGPMEPIAPVETASVTLNHLKSYTALTGGSNDSSVFSSSSLTSALGALQIPMKPPASALSNSLPSSIGGSSRMPGSPMTSVGQQLRPKVQRTRGPTSSKIPSMAVEMPDDTIANLDVQFGSLEFGGEQSSLGFNSLIKSASSLQALQPSSGSISSGPLPSQSPASSSVSSSLSNSILRATASNILKNGSDGDLVSASVSTYSQPSVSLMTVNKDVAQAVSQQISSSDSGSYSNSESRNAVPFSSGVQRSGSSSALESVGSKLAESAAISAAYGIQDTSGAGSHSSYQSPYGNHKSSANSYSSHHHQHQQQQQQQQQHHSNAVQQQQQQQQQTQSQSLYGGGGGVGSSALGQVQSTASYSSVPSGYGGGGGGGSQTPQSSYGQSSVYANPVATVSTFASGSSISQTGYSLQSHNSLHSSGTKLPSSLANTAKDPMDSTTSQHMYDSSHTTSTSSLTSPLTTPSSAAGASSALGLAAGTLSNSNSLSANKSSISTNKSGPPSLPPGVPMVHSHQYIMGQASLPFYSLPQPMYAYEDLQMVPQRLPMASYYDMSFQPSTTLTSRDGGLSNVAYSNTDGKFARGENSSPVPTTLSQQSSSQHQQQQAFISPTALPHPYGYYYPSQVVAGGFAQYGTPIFPMPPATNAHGVTTNTHFQKPNAYGSHGYTSGYENIGQSQDYSKSNYGSSSQNQSKVMAGTSAGGSANSVGGNDIPSSVYSKAHSQMNKQTFDKPGFHAGTPPPFNMASSQPGSLGGPSTAYAAQFIPMMTQHPSPMMHHQLHPDSGNASQRLSAAQNKATASSKQGYGTSYWNTS